MIDTSLMDIEGIIEFRRICLQKLIDKHYNGVHQRFADALGIEASYVSRMLYETGKKGKRNIGERMAARITELHPGWLDQTNVEDYEDEIVLSRPVNISGEIQGGDGGYLNIQQYPAGYSTGCVMHPVKNPRCYALKVRGDSMAPRIRHGEIIVIDPDHSPEPGDDVVVSLRDGRQMVKVYLYKKQNEITLGSINDGHGNITISMEQIYEIHYVAARLPSGTICNRADL